MREEDIKKIDDQIRVAIAAGKRLRKVLDDRAKEKAK